MEVVFPLIDEKPQWYFFIRPKSFAQTGRQVLNIPSDKVVSENAKKMGELLMSWLWPFYFRDRSLKKFFPRKSEFPCLLNFQILFIMVIQTVYRIFKSVSFSDVLPTEGRQLVKISDDQKSVLNSAIVFWSWCHDDHPCFIHSAW